MFSRETKLLLLLSVILIMGVSAVSATDINDTLVLQDNSQQVETSTISGDNNIEEVSTQIDTTKTVENNKLGDGEGTLSDLSTLINDATGDTITLDKGYTSATGESLIIINKNITIDGDGNTIIGTNGTFNITVGNTVTLKNLIITGKNGSNPMIDNYGTLNLVNVTITDCNSTNASNPAIMLLRADSILTLTNCSVDNMCATYSSFMMYARSQAIVNNSNFTNTRGRNGVFYLYGANSTLNLTESRFINCRNDNYGGSIYVNTVAYLNVDNCYFENNSAETRGGVISARGVMNIANSVFVNNSLNGSNYQYGGVINMASGASLYLSNNTMIGNVARHGADIYREYGTVNSTVSIIMENKTFDVEDTIVLEATITDDIGNSIANGGVTFTINGSEYTATTNANGTATATVTKTLDEDQIYEVTATFTNAPEENQTTQTASIIYGSILPDMYDYTTLQSVINDQEDGAIIKLKQNIIRNDTNSETTINVNKNITINGKGVTIDASEGSMFVIDAEHSSVTLTLMNLVLTNVKATSGAIFSNYGNIVLENVTILDSTTDATTDSNLIYIGAGASLKINNSIIKDINSSLISNNGILTIDNTNLTSINNNQQNAIIFGEATSLEISNSLFENNTGYYGLISGDSSSGTIDITNSIFKNNINTNGNGGVINTKSTTTITNSTFIDNKASATTAVGGVIYVTDGSATLNKNIFINNTATSSASIIATASSGTFTLKNSILLSNDSKTLLKSSNTENMPTADANWWGTNDNPNTLVSGVTVNNWRIMDAMFTVDEDDNTVFTIDVTFNKLLNAEGDESTTTETLPDVLEVTYTATTGSLTNSTTTVVDDVTSNILNMGLTESTITITQSNQVITHSIDAPEIDPKNYDGVQKLINGASTDSTITLTKDVTRGSNEVNITINKDIVIDGDGFTIDANSGKLFYIANATVTLKNLIIINAGGNVSATIINATNSKIILENVTIKDSSITTTYSYGAKRGVLYIDSTSSLTINNSVITNITGTFLYSDGNTTINNTNITSIIANNSYYVQWIASNNTQIENSIFENNIGYSIGFNVTGNLSIVNSSFKNNTVSYTTGSGAAIYYVSSTGNATITSSNFTENFLKVSGYSARGGAAIYLDGNMSITDSIFDSNYVTKASSGYSFYMSGAAIYAYGGNLYVDNSTFTKNYLEGPSASSTGGAIYIGKNATINNSIFEENSVNGTGGAIYMSAANLNLTNSKFINNNANNTAGVLYLYGTAYLTNNTMTDNTATNGSTIYLYSNNALIPANITFNDAKYGEGDTIILNATVTDDMGNNVTGGRVTFTVNDKNYTSTVVDGFVNITVTGELELGTIYEITGVYAGSPIDNQTIKTGNLTYGTILPNIGDYEELQTVLDEYEEESIIRLNDDITRATGTETNIVLNRSVTIEGKGHTIDAKDGSLFIINNSATVTLRNMTIINVDANTLGSFVTLNSGKLIIENVTLSVSTDGSKSKNVLGDPISDETITSPILVNDTGATLQIINSTIKDIEATAIVNNGILEILDSVITNIESENAVIYTNGTLTIKNTTFTGNTGDVIFVNTTGITTINNATFTDNTAINAVIYIIKGNATINYSTFDKNTGVLIASAESGTFNVSNSILLKYGLNDRIHNTATDTPIADFNWFGSNTSPADVQGVTINNWIIMDVTVTPSESDNFIQNIEVSFNKYTDSTGAVYDLEGTIPDGLEVTYAVSSGTLDKESQIITDGEDTNTLSMDYEANTLTITQTNQITEINLTKPVIDPTSYSGVEKLIKYAEGNTITLTQNVTRASLEENITIDKNITIDGNGVTINANGGAFIKIARDLDVTLKNMIIANITDSYIIEVLSNTNLTLENVTFINVKSDISSGRFFDISTTGNLILDMVTITNFTNGKLLYNLGTVIINKSNISDVNTTDVTIYWGYNSGSLSINNTIFENIASNATGIQNSGNLIINNTTFNKINTGNRNPHAYGGVINNTVDGSVIIDNSVFNNTYSLGSYYGIMGGVINSRGILIIFNSNFTNNIANSTGDSAFGGVIYSNGTTTVNNSVFINNTADFTYSSSYSARGGAIYVGTGTVNINNSIFINNSAKSGGHIIFVNSTSSSLNISNSVLYGSNTTNYLIYGSSSSNQYANNNWWGSNSNPSSYVRSVTLNSWIIMNSSVSVKDASEDTFTITVTFDKVTNAAGEISDLEGTIPDGLEVSYSVDKGELESESTLTMNGVATNTLTSDEISEVTVTQDGQVMTVTATPEMKNTTLTVTTNVTKADYGDNVTITVNLVDSKGKLLNGTVILNVNGVNENVTVTDGVGSYVYEALNSGTIPISALYEATELYNTSSYETSFYVKGNTSIVLVYAGNVTYGDMASIVVFLKDEDDVILFNKTLVLSIGGQTFTNITSGGVLIFTYTPTSAKDLEFSITFATDDDYMGTTLTDTLTVNKAKAVITFENQNVTVKDNITLTAYVNNVYGNPINEGNVTFTINGTPQTVKVADGVATYNLGTKSADTYNITASYTNDNYESVDATSTILVNRLKVNITIMPLIVDATVGENASVVIILTDSTDEVITGQDVEVTIDGVSYNYTTDESGTISLNYTLETSGENSLIVSMPEDDNYESVIDSTTYEVEKANTVITVSPVTATINSYVNLIATVTDTKENLVSEGKVTFFVDDTEVGTVSVLSGVATLNYLTTKVGTQIIKAVFNDTDNYVGGNNENTLAVSRLGSIIIASNIITNLGDSVNITATVIDSNNAMVTEGTITFTDASNKTLGTSKVTNGTASIKVVFNTTGTNRITLTYGNSTSYDESNTTINVTANKINVVVSANNITGRVNTATTIRVNVTSSIVVSEGNVTVRDVDGKLLASGVVKNGTVNLTLGTSAFNTTYNSVLIVNYTGSTKFESSVTVVKANISRLNASINTVRATSARVGANINISVNIIDSNKANVTSGQVQFVYNNSVIGTANVSRGNASIVTKFTTTANSVKINYIGGDKYSNATKTVTINATKLNSTVKVSAIKARIGDNITLTANVTDSAGNKVNYGTVYFRINGTNIKYSNGTAVSASVVNGTAKAVYMVPSTWNGNVSKFSAYYSSPVANTSSSISSNVTVNVTTRPVNVTFFTDSNSYYTGDKINVRVVITDNGVLVNGGTVTFKFNGVTLKYTNGSTVQVAVRNGVASVSYTLPSNIGAGNHTFNIVFGGGIYQRYEATTKISVLKTDVHVEVSPIIATGKTTRISARVYDGHNTAIKGTTKVSIKIAGSTFVSNANITNGVISFTVNTNFATGLYDVSISVGENSYYKGTRIDTKLLKT